MTRATIYIKRRCRQTVRPLLSTNDNRSLSQGGAVIVFYCAGRSLPRLAKLPIRLSTPYAHPLLGARLNRHLWPGNRPCGRPASDHRAAARRAVCGSAVFMIQYSTFSVNQSVNLFPMLDGGGGACYNIHKEALPADGSPPFKEKTMTVILC